MEKIEPDYRNYYPELSKEGQERTQAIINKFAGQLKDLMSDTVVSFTENIAAEIVDDDAWIDIRQKTRDALCGYEVRGNYSAQNWVGIRKKILEENREAIVNDIILDKEAEIKRLQQAITDINKLR